MAIREAICHQSPSHPARTLTGQEAPRLGGGWGRGRDPEGWARNNRFGGLEQLRLGGPMGVLEAFSRDQWAQIA